MKNTTRSNRMLCHQARSLASEADPLGPILVGYRTVMVTVWSFSVALLGAACGGDESTLPGGSQGDESLVRNCAESGDRVEPLDADLDGRPDIRHVFRGARRVCSEFDLNRDGQIDVARFYAADGETTAVEQHDLDFDGRLDQITYFEGNEVARRELDTNFDDVIDSWLWCDAGLISHAEHDRRNTGSVDTWEDYENGYLVAVRYDDNNDGKPEKWEIFEAGRLKELRYDTNEDGEPDQSEEIPSEQAGPPDEPIRCDGTAMPPPPRPEQPAAPAAPEAEATGTESEDGGGNGDENSPFGSGTGTDEPFPGEEQDAADETAGAEASEPANDEAGGEEAGEPKS